MVHIREAVVVEGKYDKMRLAEAVDGIILETGGFRVFKDAAQKALLRRLAAERGLIVLTDSDSAGLVIRNHLQSILPPGQIKHAYCPALRGKERRKSAPSKEGLLGVEGVGAERLVEALRRAGATLSDTPHKPGGFTLTKARMMADGLSGGSDSAARRDMLLAWLELPRYLSANRLRELLEAFCDETDYTAWLAKLDEAFGRRGQGDT